MNTIIEKVGQIIIEAMPALLIMGIVTYIVFFGPLADFMQMFASWLYG